MKPTTINVQITKCPKQYEAVRLGMEASLEPGESVEIAIEAATSQLTEIYNQMHTGGAKAPQVQAPAAPATPAPAPAQEPAKPAAKKAAPANDERELLTFDDNRVQQIVKRLEKKPGQKDEILANVQKYYRCDEQVASVLGLAEKLI